MSIQYTTHRETTKNSTKEDEMDIKTMVMGDTKEEEYTKVDEVN
jgi:hypothetical protein